MKNYLKNKPLPKPIHNPWTVLGRTHLYQNPWIAVQEDQVLNPNGGKGIYGTISFKNKALGIVPLDSENFTWLVGQYRYPLGEYSWEIPMGGGKINPENSDIESQLLETAQRELLEETGIIAQKWTKIARIHTSNSVTDEEGFVYMAQNLAQTQSLPEETEQLEVLRVHITDALRMVLNSEITDAISMIGIMKVANLLGM